MHNTRTGQDCGISDDELVVALRRGDRDAYAMVFTRFHPPTLRYARAITRSLADAEDITSEALVRMMSAIDAGTGPTLSVPAYLRTSVWRLSTELGVRAARQLPMEIDMIDRVAVPGADAVTGESELLGQAFQSLPARWRQALWLVEVLGYRPNELAEMLGITPPAACSLLWRARRALRREYGELGG